MFNAKHFSRNRKEEHYSPIKKSGSMYNGYVSLLSSSIDVTWFIVSHLYLKYQTFI